MEPLTALLAIALSFGASALVKALGGGAELSSLSGELVKALADTESKIDERLAGIELKLDQLLDQRYNVALSSGVRYLLEAVPAEGMNKDHDLDRARDRFIEAQSAARSSLQQAIAERYLLLCSVSLQRTDLVKDGLTRLEGLAMTAALEAMRLTEFNGEQAAALMQHEGSSLRNLADRDRRHRAQLQVKSAALDTICMSSRLLAEAAVLGPVFGFSARIPPPTGAINDPFFTEQTRKVSGNRIEYTYSISAPEDKQGYWTFTMKADEILRIGPFMVQIQPLPARQVQTRSSTPRLAARSSAFSSLFDEPPDLARQQVRLDLDQPLPLGIRVEVSTAHPRPGAILEISGKGNMPSDGDSVGALQRGLTGDRNAKLLKSGETWAELPIPPAKSDNSALTVTITPSDVFRSLIEVDRIT